MTNLHTIYWPPHVWHDCDKYGCSPSEYNCNFCRGGLTACVVCGQAEGMIADFDKCPGPIKLSTRANALHLLRYHNEVAPLFRAATQDDYIEQRIKHNEWLPAWCQGVGWWDVERVTFATGTGIYCDGLPGGCAPYYNESTSMPERLLGVYDPYKALECPTNNKKQE